MFTGRLTGKRVIIDDPKSASSLRNKGFSGINKGEKLSLDIFTAYFLFVKKRIQIIKNKKKLSNEELAGIIGDDMYLFYAFKFLREKGYRPKVRRNRIYVDGEITLVLRYRDIIDFKRIKKKICVIVVDEEGDCILYEFQLFQFRNNNMKKILDMGTSLSHFKLPIFIDNEKEISIRSGSKYGSDFRIYDGTSIHAKYLLNIEDSISTKELVARVRVAHSVKKLYLQGYYNKRMKFILIKWITV